MNRKVASEALGTGNFVNYFSELIRLKLRSRLNSKEAIQDVRQETFMRVLILLRGKGGRAAGSIGTLRQFGLQPCLVRALSFAKERRRRSTTKWRPPLLAANQVC